jgi:hypothetical protein
MGKVPIKHILSPLQSERGGELEVTGGRSASKNRI